MDALSSKFSIDFQTRMIALAATQPYFLGLYSDIFKPGLFTSVYHRDYCSWISSFYEKYKVPPSRTSMTKILREKVPKDAPLHKGYKLLLEQIYGMEVLDSEYVKDQIIVASKYQSRKAALLRMTDQLESGQFEDMDYTYEQCKRAGSGAGDVGHALTKSVNEAILKFGFLEQPVRTGFDEMERAIGGFYDGELTVIVAPPNQGKTAYAGNIGYGASLHDNVVMYYTLEIGALRMLNRFYANMSKQPTKDLYLGIDKVRNAVKLYRLRTGGEIYVKFFPAGSITVETLRSHLAMVNGHDIRPKMVIVDYADLLQPTNPKDPPPDRVKQTYRNLRTMGGEFNCHVLSLSQSTRSTLYARIIDLDDMAESWGKAQEADSIGAVCQTREEKLARVARLYWAKTRNETSGKFVYTRNKYETLTVREITKEKHKRYMAKAGFEVPDDQPKMLRTQAGKATDKDLDDRYSDGDDEYIKKKIRKHKKRK